MECKFRAGSKRERERKKTSSPETEVVAGGLREALRIGKELKKSMGQVESGWMEALLRD